MDKYIGIVIVYALLLAVYASIKKKAPFFGRSIVKMTLSTMFLLVAGLGLKDANQWTVSVFVALCFAWIGDWFLRYMGISAAKFNVGVVAFAVCQCVLVGNALFYGGYGERGLLLPGAFLIAGLSTLVLWRMLAKSNAELGISYPFVKGYMFTMSVLFGVSVYFMFTSGGSLAEILMTAGMFLFYVSDLFLGVYSYISKKTALTVLNSITYFGGMMLIALSAAI